ncbi:peptidoglycan DL-endopeptidase CwlO [Enterococcus sp. DIV0212c]|uniref:C40 family peptidase n=1 Tax=Enterococcus sp. DIV0212c TaxID=2230867 RepID=UPI001A9B4256|nr:C40 family peptidase [Enterococcus sp. DIV0212c]MBO1354022.1 C40 family peptidase [Enterococcus sp. DIV0212c]
MKKNTFITSLLLSFLTLSAGLSLGDQAFATPAEQTTTSEKIISDSSQKISKLKEVQQKFSEQKTKKKSQLATLEDEIKNVQIDLDQLEEIESIGMIAKSSEQDKNQTAPLYIEFSSISIKDNKTAHPIDEKKAHLADLKQEFDHLNLETETITKQQSEVTKQESQLSEKITQAKQQKTVQEQQKDTRTAIITAAKTHLGKPYVYGAAGPDAFDCSGLVQVAFATAGRSLGRTTVDQETAGATISVSEAQAGDLVFWGSHGGTYHVGISTGDGSYIHAPVPGDVVQVATVASYAPDFAIRVL